MHFEIKHMGNVHDVDSDQVCNKMDKNVTEAKLCSANATQMTSM